MAYTNHEDQLAAQRRWYEANRESEIKRTSVRRDRVRAENRTRVAEYLVGHPCVDCGESDSVVLDFDHVRGEKHRNISRMVVIGSSWAAIQEEIEKCDVRCANCHRRRTASKQDWHKARRARLDGEAAVS